MRHRILGSVGAIALLGCTSAATADVTFSFASDDNRDGPTFWGFLDGGLNRILDAGPFSADGWVNVDMMVDPDGDGPGGSTAFATAFEFDGITTRYLLIPFNGGFIHQWLMEGQYFFEKTGTGLHVLDVHYQRALLTSWSPSPSVLGDTMTLQDSWQVDPALLFVAGDPLNGLGIFDADLIQPDYAFTFTNIRSIETGARPLIGAKGEFIDPWISEGSWSAHGVPAPGAFALLGYGLLAARRRRRA